MSNSSKRKHQHITLAQNPNSQSNFELFKDITLPYNSLPEINPSDVSTEVKLLNKIVSQPLIISSMTGGTENAKTINTNLAIACEEMQVAFGVGSMRIALDNLEAVDSFTVVRKLAPTTFIFANMGAVQLNYGKNIDDYKRIVDLIKADALYLHLNPLQEALQPEGDTNWNGLTNKVINLVKNLDTPVFIKEVGHGLDPETARTLIEAGAAGIDSAGVGGTSWAWIESMRSENLNFQNWFKDFGYKTEYLVPKLAEIKGKSVLVASGGIRNPIQGLKTRLLGADFYAAAQPFLKPALENPEAVISQLSDWQRALKISLFSIGAKNWTQAAQIPISPV